MTIYIYDNETGEQVDAHTADSNEQCERWANDKYGINDYTWSYHDQPTIAVD